MSPHEEYGEKEAPVTLIKTVDREEGEREGKQPLSGVLLNFYNAKVQGKC